MSNDSLPTKHSTVDFAIALANEQARHVVDEERLIAAARAILAESKFASAALSLVVVDDSTIHELNRRYLGHDYATDVLSFALGEQGRHLEGEVIISADMAAAEAAEIGWPAASEQLLYVIHGMLHLLGYRDKSPADARAMRTAEDKYLRQFGIEQPRRGQRADIGDKVMDLATDRDGGESAS